MDKLIEQFARLQALSEDALANAILEIDNEGHNRITGPEGEYLGDDNPLKWDTVEALSTVCAILLLAQEKGA